MNKNEDDIMKNWKGNLQKPLVSIRCTTYNQVDYIEQTINGFLIQVTNFPFEIVIHDDASTDGTTEVIKKYAADYPNIIKPIYEEKNLFSLHDGTMTKVINKYLNGEYIAFCEGDDYWIDKYKLQKQVDYMNENPQVGMCYTNFNIFEQESQTFRYDLFITEPINYPHEYTLEKWILNLGYIAPMTWLIRRNLWMSYEKMPSSDGSFVMVAHYLSKSQIACLVNETTAVYRVLSESASHSVDFLKSYIRMKNLREVQKQLIDKYNLNKELYQRIDEKYYNIVFYYVCMTNEKEEIQNLKKYCKFDFKRYFFYYTSKLSIMRKFYIKHYSTLRKFR